MDELLLIKHVAENEDDNAIARTVEYCLIGCSGLAHQTGQPESVSYFCSHHVHRSVHVSLKEGAVSQSLAGVFG